LPTEVDFDRFFTLRFLIGEAVIDNLGQHDGPVRSLLRQRGHSKPSQKHEDLSTTREIQYLPKNKLN
jgi:hypothetical protein